MRALDHLVRQGKALYVGIQLSARPGAEAVKILNDLGTPCVIHQPRYSMFERWVEEGLLDFLQTEGVGSIAFSPLAGGQLTDRYLNGIPADSRAASGSRFLQPEQLTAQARKNSSAEYAGGSPRAEAVADGAGLGAARGESDLRADWRQQNRAA
jgi:aryl-alcohol dehydrogenase-like predicted oxidoreductase